MTDCITSLPSASSTATEIVLWWTSRPIYLMLSIGCSFRQVWFTASHSNHSLLRKGRPFIMRGPCLPPIYIWLWICRQSSSAGAPDLALFRDLGGYDVRLTIPRVSKARDSCHPTAALIRKSRES